MLQSSFTTIKHHFSPTTPHTKSIFTFKDYDYPSPFIQRLYLSYLQLEDLLKTRPAEEITKRINIVSNKNDKNFEKVVMGFVYAMMVHCCERKVDKEKQSEKERESMKGNMLLLQSNFDQKMHSQRINEQLAQYFPLFRNEAWSLFNTITLELLLTHFNDIKPTHLSGFVAILRVLLKFSTCSDDLFIALMKTLNFYDQRALSVRYNLEVLEELGRVVSEWKLSISSVSEIGGLLMPGQLALSEAESQKNYSKSKLNEQVSLMRNYLFGKLVHWQYLAHKMATYMKSEWPYNLQRSCQQSLILLKTLYLSNPQECLVFSHQLSRYSQFPTPDPQLTQILHQILLHSHKPIPPHMIGHHYSLVPISMEFLLPGQLDEHIGRLARVLYGGQSAQEQGTRVEKQNVHMVLTWLWREAGKRAVEESTSSNSSRSYLMENSFQDLIRWCLVAHNKNLELRSFVVEWVFYNTMGTNQAVSRTVKQAYFSDWLFYLRTAQQTQLPAVFPILTSSLHLLNYFSFCAPSIAEHLFLYILGKNITLKTAYQSGSINEGMFRGYVNEILRRATHEGVLRLREILGQSQLSNYVKSELEMRVLEAESVEMKQREKGKVEGSHPSSHPILTPHQPQPRHMLPPSSLQQQQPQYYGTKNLNIKFDIKDVGILDHSHDDEDDQIVYTSHQFIPASPSYGGDDDGQEENDYNGGKNGRFELEMQEGGGKENKAQKEISREKVENGLNVENRQKVENSFKRDTVVPSHQLQQQIKQQQNIKPHQPDPRPQLPYKQPQKPQLQSQQSQPLQQPLPLPISTPIPTTLIPPPPTYHLTIQKQFLQQMGPSIRSLFSNPTVPQFTDYMKQLIKILKEYKKLSQEEEMVEKFLQETAKIVYIAFNKEFEGFDFSSAGEESGSSNKESTNSNNKQSTPKQTPSTNKQSTHLTYFLLRSIHQHWKQALVIYNIQVYKKLVKYLCQAFPSCQFSFYFVFLDIFKKGVPNYRDMKPWLFAPEREKVVVPVLQKIMGARFKVHVYENAQVLRVL